MKLALGLSVFAFLLSVPAFAPAQPSVYPLGTTIYKPDKCWNGFTILSSEEGRLA